MSSDRSRGHVQPFGTQLEGIAEAARLAGMLIDPEGHDWEPDVMVRAHGGAWLISPWSSGSPRGWCAQQMVMVELGWVRIPGTRAWLGGADREPYRIVAGLLEAVELPGEPYGQSTISTRRVPDAEIRDRLAWLGSSGSKIAKAHPPAGGTMRPLASLATAIGSFAASTRKELGGRAGAAGVQAVAEGARRLRGYLHSRDQGQDLRIVPQAGTAPIPDGRFERPSRLDTRDGEGLLEWDAEAKRWRYSSPDPGSESAQVPHIQVRPKPLNGITDSPPRALTSAREGRARRRTRVSRDRAE